MKLEVGRKYTDGRDIVEVKFFDYEGTAWCLSNRNYCRYIHKDESNWQEVTDTPDPGEGWRLLHPDEDLEEGDEWWSQSEQTWIPSLQSQTIQNHGWCYRRRIAPQYVPYTWEDREELRGRWYRRKGDNCEFMVNYVTRHNENDISIGPWREGAFFKQCEWLDGSPCGKRVV